MKYAFIIAVAIGATTACSNDEKNEPAAEPGAAAPAAPAAATPAVAAEPPAAEVTYCGAEPCPCEPGSEKMHHGTEELRQCKLTRAMDVQGYPVKQGGEITFTQDGKVRRLYLSKDFEVGGYPAKDQTGIELFTEGSVKSVFLREPTEIDGVTCTDGVAFFESGKLRRCKLAAEAELSGHKPQPGDFVTFDKDGKLHRWEIGDDRVQKIGEYECSGYLNYVHPTGELLRCGFVKATKVEGKKYEKGDLVCFDTAGKVTDCKQFTFDIGGG